jgi:hypothetical protein
MPQRAADGEEYSDTAADANERFVRREPKREPGNQPNDGSDQRYHQVGQGGTVAFCTEFHGCFVLQSESAGDDERNLVLGGLPIVTIKVVRAS